MIEFLIECFFYGLIGALPNKAVGCLAVVAGVVVGLLIILFVLSLFSVDAAKPIV